MERNTKSIVEAVALNAERIPDKIAIIEHGNPCSYAQLWEMIQEDAFYLSQKGLKPQDKVVLRVSNTIHYLVRLLAIHGLGGAAAPVEKNTPVERIREIAGELEAKIISVDEDITDAGVTVISEALNTAGERKIIRTFPAETDLADILFTTGTTGRSKGVMLSHKTVVTVTENIIDYTEMQEDERELIPLPLNHTHGLRRCYSNLYYGSTLVLIDGLSKPAQLYQAFETEKITALSVTPLMFTMICRMLGDKMIDYSEQIRYVQFGAAALPEEDKVYARKYLPKSRLYNIYGTTEAGATSAFDFNHDNIRTSCIGKPTLHTEMFFVNKERERISATKDHPGYISVRGPGVMDGYWKEEALTREVLSGDQYYSKDLGYMDQEGYVYFLGREDDIINIGGIKISPLEIEEVALKHPGIRECLCTFSDSDRWGECLKLSVVMEEGCAFQKKEIENHMRKYLENSRLPKIYEQIDRVPRTFNDKIIRR